MNFILYAGILAACLYPKAVADRTHITTCVDGYVQDEFGDTACYGPDHAFHLYKTDWRKCYPFAMSHSAKIEPSKSHIFDNSFIPRFSISTGDETGFIIAEKKASGIYIWCGSRISEKDFFEKVGRWYWAGKPNKSVACKPMATTK